MSVTDNLEYKKLHQLSPLFMLVDTIKEFFLIIVLALFASQQAESWQLWAIGVSAVFVLFRMVGIRFFKYKIANDELIVKQGILFKQERHIPFERIQNVNETQGILHRFFKVSKVVLESASGQRPEAVFNVISRAAVEEIRSSVASHDPNANGVASHSADAEYAGTSGSVLLKMDVGDIVRHGLATLQGMIPVAIFFGFFAQQDWLWDSLFAPVVQNLPGADNINPEMLESAPGLVVGSILGLILMGLFAFGALSVLYSLLRFYDFTLTRETDKLLARRGLLTKQSSSTSLQRIQKINIYQNLIHRMFGSVSISCKTAGNAVGSAEQVAKFDVLAPMLEKSESREFLYRIFPELNWSFLESESDVWTAIPYRSWRRAVKWEILFFTGVALLLSLWVKYLALLFWIPALVWSVYDAQREARAAAFISTDDYIVYRSGWISRNLSIVPLQKAQAANLKQNIFDRRHRMAGFELDTAGVSVFEHGVNIRYLELKDAQALQNLVLRRTNELAFEW